MPKLSRPVIYTLVGAVVFYAIFDLTQPPPPTSAPHVTHLEASASLSADTDMDTAQADTTAHFPRYAGSRADPFRPKVLPAGAGGKAKAGVDAGKWTLTGIYAISGSMHALVENPATGETAALQPGDHWRGLRVASIGANAVQFENALGQQTQLAFPQPPAPRDSTVPANLGPLPPMPVTGPLRPLPPLQSVPISAGNPGRTSHP